MVKFAIGSQHIYVASQEDLRELVLAISSNSNGITAMLFAPTSKATVCYCCHGVALQSFSACLSLSDNKTRMHSIGTLEPNH